MQHYPASTESVSNFAWKSLQAPRRVLIIRMHAIGDVAVTIPAVVGFLEQFPHTQVDFLTTQICAPLLDSLSLRGDLLSFPDHLDRWHRFFQAIQFGNTLRKMNYDVVIDLQRSWVSRLIRRMISPRAWSEFERFTPKTAGERVLTAFRAAGFEHNAGVHRLPIKDKAIERGKGMLRSSGWSGTSRLIVLNPAGLWVTRQWPLENYLHVARLMLKEQETQFVLIGTDRIRDKARYITEQLGSQVVDLVDRTTLGEALAILQWCSGVVTEDSGLMHMAWASGIPTVALLGSTNHVWSAPTGAFVRCYHSGDLPCGACLQPQCKYADIHCLTRVTPHMVHEAMQELLATPRTTVRTGHAVASGRSS
jgi:heptosyltransferase-2